MSKAETKVISLLPKQRLFMMASQREVLFSGGYGSAKSFTLCQRAVVEALKPGNEVLLCRKTLASLKRSTLVTLIGGDKPALPDGSYTFNRGDGVIQINGGGKIYLSGLDDEGLRIKSMNLGAAFLDEGSELSEQEYLAILYRLRLPNGTRQLFCATNPSGTHHFMFQRFFQKPSKNRLVITSSSLENTFLPEDYIESLLEMDEQQKRRYVEGLWVSMEGLIYSFDFSTQVKTELALSDQYLLGIDIGFRDKTAMLLLGRSGDHLHAIREVYRSHMMLNEIVEEAKSLADRYSPTILLDPSAALVRAELEAAGLTVAKTNNNINIGIQRTQQFVKKMTVDPSCTGLQEELASYCWKQGTKDEPASGADHLLDCLRYCSNHICDRFEDDTPLVVYSGGQDELDDEF